MLSTGFAGFDVIAGGLVPNRNYLLDGEPGSGKSAFALGWLHEGLVRGEVVALVTMHAADSIFQQGRSLGMELEPHVQNGRLLLFEYPEELLRNEVPGMGSAEMAEELFCQTGGAPLDRLVLDPVTPLLRLGAAEHTAERSREVAEAFSRSGATVVVVLDAAGEQEFGDACREAADGVLHFHNSGSGGLKTLEVERFPDPCAAGARVGFEIQQGLGLMEAPLGTGSGGPAEARSGRSTRKDGGARALVVHPDGARRSLLRRALESELTVIEAHGAGDGLALLSAEKPDVLILNLELSGVTGGDIARRFRRNGGNTPIVALSENVRRTQDVLQALQAGVDVCLQEPADPRLLRLHVFNLLSRTGVLAPDFGNRHVPITAREVHAVACTADVQRFNEALKQAVHRARTESAPFVLFALRVPDGGPATQDMAAVAALLVRIQDLVLMAPEGVAGLLVDVASAGPLLTRFRQRWTGPEPVIAELPWDDSEDFPQRAWELLTAVGAWKTEEKALAQGGQD